MAGGNNTDCWGVFDPRELQESQELHKWPFPTSHLLDDSESPKEKMKGDTSITSHNYGRTIQPTFWSFNLKARRADHTYVRSPAAAISVESLPTSAYYTSWVTALRAMGKTQIRTVLGGIMMGANFAQNSLVHETIHIKSGAWDDAGCSYTPH